MLIFRMIEVIVSQTDAIDAIAAFTGMLFNLYDCMWNISDNLQDKKSPKFKKIQMLKFNNVRVKAAIARTFARRSRPFERR